MVLGAKMIVLFTMFCVAGFRTLVKIRIGPSPQPVPFVRWLSLAACCTADRVACTWPLAILFGSISDALAIHVVWHGIAVPA